MSRKQTPEQFWSDFVTKYFQFFKEIYSSEKEMLEYGLKFQQIGDTGKAFLELYTISEFYRALRLVQDGFVKLIMIISLIERLSSKKDYIDFSKWISINNIEVENVLRAWNNYNDRDGFGCSHKFRSFFKNKGFLGKAEQLSLLKSVKAYFAYKGKRITAPLFCYGEDCGKGIRDCVFHYDQKPVLNTLSRDEDGERVRYNIEDCSLFQNETMMNRALNEFANFIYQMRNKFVHNATLFHISEEFLGSTSFMVDYLEYEFRYVKKPEFKGAVILQLSPETFEKLLNRNFKKMLESYIAFRVGNVDKAMLGTFNSKT